MGTSPVTEPFPPNEVSASNQNPTGSGAAPPSNKSSKTKFPTILFVIILVLSTILLLHWAKEGIAHIEQISTQETRTKWRLPEGVALRPGPSDLYYDREKQEIAFRGTIDDQKKSQLMGLYPLDSPSSADHASSYWAAIDELTYSANEKAKGLALSLLMLGGIVGALGVQLRSFTNFIGHACYKNDFNLALWWPYYVLRPFIGFILGAGIVTIVRAGMFTVSIGNISTTLWWVSVSFLAGFGEEEFLQRLRLTTKTLFGEGKPSDK